MSNAQRKRNKREQRTRQGVVIKSEGQARIHREHAQAVAVKFRQAGWANA